ncbi:MAG: N-acetylmuramoyl-L-alanine amidase [Lachnospiraceae bacterium]|nr:N-acetylmuramoyl-L-alanine amidase [Lachnospiraceae bacterium]
MKRLLTFLLSLTCIISIYMMTAYAGELNLPMAGAERVFSSMPVNYVYEPELWSGSAMDTSEDTQEEDTQGGTDQTEEAGEETAEDSELTSEQTPEQTSEQTENTETSETSEVTEESASAGGSVVVNNRIVCIDAGHQAKGDSSKEPIGPGATETKAKVASGTTGTVTGVPEYQLTLDVALKLQAELESRGYKVVMCRTTHNVNISNSERAAIANNAGAGAFLRLHGNGSSSSSVAGAEALAPSTANPYCASIAPASQTLSKCVLDGMCAASGAANRGVKIYDNMSGINWSKVPVTIIEMGYMTNPAEDQAMQDSAYQTKLAKGMADGVDKYFGL